MKRVKEWDKRGGKTERADGEMRGQDKKEKDKEAKENVVRRQERRGYTESRRE